MAAGVVARRKTVLARPNHPPGDCVRCGEFVPIAARRLCDACYAAVRKAGILADYPRTRRLFADTIAEYAFLRSTGESEEQIARRLGYSQLSYLQGLVKRARREGLLPAGGGVR